MAWAGERRKTGHFLALSGVALALCFSLSAGLEMCFFKVNFT